MKYHASSLILRSYCVVLFAVVSGAFGCEQDQAPGPFEGPGLHVLFIGNSLTYYNDLGGTVAAIAALDSQAISQATVAKPDFALIDHLDGGSNAVSEIKRGGWDFVVLQQGPSSLPDSRDMLISGTVRFDQIIRAAGARTALYMVWPSRDRLAFMEDVRLSYKMAADTVGGIFLPAGEAWANAWQGDSSLFLYGLDDLHPSGLGTFLAGLVIYERLTGRDVRNLPPTAVIAERTLTIPESTVRLLHQAAHAANARYAATPPSIE